MRASKIIYAGDSDRELWDAYVRQHPDASLCHLFGWREVIHATYGHPTYYLILKTCGVSVGDSYTDEISGTAESVIGVLPVVHFKHAIFGNSLVSMPFLDGGGILADSKEAEECLLSEVVRLGRNIGANCIELRHERLLSSCEQLSAFCSDVSTNRLQLVTKSNKVRMLLTLPDSSESLMQSFRSKLRSQVSKPLKEGLTSKTGGVELLDDFYKVFLVNMRDLGSPVHSMKMMWHALSEFSECSRIVVVYREKDPVAASLVIGFDTVLRNPWASSLRKYASLSPNMLLYFRMLEYASDHGYRFFDFGRSSVGEGTHRFKEQWGAKPLPLYWHYFSLNGKLPNPESTGKKKFESATHVWKRLPLVVTKVVGPHIRKHISL